MTEYLSKRRKEFFERWALANAPILAAAVMMAGVIARNVDSASFSPTFWDAAKRIGLLGLFAVALPVNGIYLFGSAHIHFQQQWKGHRSFWLWLVFGCALWSFVIFGSVVVGSFNGVR